MYALRKSSGPANVLKDLRSCSIRWLGSWLHANLFFCSQYTLHILARFLYLPVHRHFVCHHHYTSFVYFSFLNLPLSCQCIANTLSKFFLCSTLIWNAYRILLGNRQGIDHLNDVGVDEMVTLKWLLKT